MLTCFSWLMLSGATHTYRDETPAPATLALTHPGVLLRMGPREILVGAAVGSGKVDKQYVGALTLELHGGMLTEVGMPLCQGVHLRALACQRWLGLPALGSGSGALIIVLDGVMMDPLPSEFGYGAIAVVSDSALSTDLGQLKVVEDEKVEAHRHWVRERERELVRECSSVVLVAQEGERHRIPMDMRMHWRKQLKTSGGKQ